MCQVCEELVPEYYRPAMVGSLVDQKILEFLLSHHLPTLDAHLKKNQVCLLLSFSSFSFPPSLYDSLLPSPPSAKQVKIDYSHEKILKQ